MFKIIKMILYRMFNDKAFLIMPLVITPLTILASIFLTQNLSVDAKIAVINMDQININLSDIKIIKLEQKPSLSELVEGKYDAIVSNENGKINVETIKGEDFKNNIITVFNGKISKFNNNMKRGVISNLVGFITMFLLFVGVQIYYYYYIEKNGINKRILSTNISYLKYSLAHFISAFIMTFVPTITLILLGKYIFNISSIVNNFEIIFIIFTLCLLATSFGFLIATIIKSEDNGSMVGTMVVLLTTLMSGCFFDIKSDKFKDILAHLFPQKYILDFTISLENNIHANYIAMFCIIAFSFILIFMGIKINKHKLTNNLE